METWNPWPYSNLFTWNTTPFHFHVAQASSLFNLFTYYGGSLWQCLTQCIVSSHYVCRCSTGFPHSCQRQFIRSVVRDGEVPGSTVVSVANVTVNVVEDDLVIPIDRYLTVQPSTEHNLWNNINVCSLVAMYTMIVINQSFRLFIISSQPQTLYNLIKTFLNHPIGSSGRTTPDINRFSNRKWVKTMCTFGHLWISKVFSVNCKNPT